LVPSFLDLPKASDMIGHSLPLFSFPCQHLLLVSLLPLQTNLESWLNQLSPHISLKCWDLSVFSYFILILFSLCLLYLDTYLFFFR
jgi:hypothetical protein